MFKLSTLALFVVSVSCAVLNTTTIKEDDNPACWTEKGIWGPQLLEWTLGHKNNRDSRVMQIPLTAEDAFIMNPIDSRIDRPTGKLVNHNGQNTIPGGITSLRPSEKPPGGRQVSETDLYLLNAIEKLVYRADFMEKRLRRVEEMVYYVMSAGSRVDKEPCPINFMRAGSSCYHFSDMAGREKDWKSAMMQCKKMGGTLAEMETIEENQDVVTHIQTNSHLKGKEFWTGGLNPGLLWIWSNSARPVSSDNKGSMSNNSKIKGEGRCLRLSYDPQLRSYAYRGSDCSARYQYICEVSDKSTNTKLNRLAKELKIELPEE